MTYEYTEYNGLWFKNETTQAVKDILARYMQNREKIRIHYGDTATGRLWLEENDVIGRIGRSTGQIKVPLLIEGNSYGGGEISTTSILALQDAKSKEWLYKHPLFTKAGLTIEPCNIAITRKGKPARLTHSVMRDKYDNQANFESLKAAQNYIAFMNGERMRVN